MYNLLVNNWINVIIYIYIYMQLQKITYNKVFILYKTISVVY